MIILIFLAWLLLTLVLFLGKQKNDLVVKFYKTNKIIVGLIGILLFLNVAFDIFIPIYSGYFLEQLNHFGYSFLIEKALAIIAILLALCNLSSKLRENSKLQLAIVISIFVYVVFYLLCLGIPFSHYATSRIPGYTTTIFSCGIECIPIILIFMIILNVIITHFYHKSNSKY